MQQRGRTQPHLPAPSSSEICSSTAEDGVGAGIPFSFSLLLHGVLNVTNQHNGGDVTLDLENKGISIPFLGILDPIQPITILLLLF